MKTVHLRNRLNKNGTTTYYFEYYNPVTKKRPKVSSGYSVDLKTLKTKAAKDKHKRLLESMLAAKKLELVNSKFGNILESDKLNENFIDFYKDFLSNYKKTDIRMFQYTLKKLILFNNNKETLSFKSITESFCRDFADFLKNKAGLTGETPNNYFRRFKRLLKEACKEENNYLQKDPSANVTIKVNYSNLIKEVLTFEEIGLLYNTPCGNDEIKKAFIFACFTGIGIAEARIINKSNFKESENGIYLNIIRQKTRHNDVPNNISIKLNHNALKVIGDFNHYNEGIFDLKNPKTNRFYSDQNIRNVIIRWVKRAGIKKHITFYCARHSYGVMLAQTGANQFSVKKLMGHSKRSKHTDRYINYLEDYKDQTIDQIGAGESI